MTHKFVLIEDHGFYGIEQLCGWNDKGLFVATIVEPEFTLDQARRMLAILETNPDIEPDDLYRLAEAA